MPIPPGPVSVTRACPASKAQVSTRSASRPISVGRCSSNGPCASGAAEAVPDAGSAGTDEGRTHPRVEVGNELVTAPGNRGDRLRSEQLAQRRHLDLQVVLFDHQSGPDQVEQLVLADDAVALPNQHQQHVDRARSESRRRLRRRAARVGPDRAESDRNETRRGRNSRRGGSRKRSRSLMRRHTIQNVSGRAKDLIRALRRRWRSLTSTLWRPRCFLRPHLSRHASSPVVRSVAALAALLASFGAVGTINAMAVHYSLKPRHRHRWWRVRPSRSGATHRSCPQPRDRRRNQPAVQAFPIDPHFCL